HRRSRSKPCHGLEPPGVRPEKSGAGKLHRHRNLNIDAGRKAVEFRAGDADDRDLEFSEPEGFSDDVWGAREATLPIVVTDNRDRPARSAGIKYRVVGWFEGLS